MASPLDAIRDADLFSCSEPESLNCTTPEEALEEYLDSDLDPRMTVAEVVKCIRQRPIVVRSYRPMAISDAQIKSWSESALERLAEWFNDEHSDPDGDEFDAFPSDAGDVMLAAVTSIVRRARVWSCGEVGKVTLSPDEVEAVMREHRPDWFVDAPRQPGPGERR